MNRQVLLRFGKDGARVFLSTENRTLEDEALAKSGAFREFGGVRRVRGTCSCLNPLGVAYLIAMRHRTTRFQQCQTGYDSRWHHAVWISARRTPEVLGGTP